MFGRPHWTYVASIWTVANTITGVSARDGSCAKLWLTQEVADTETQPVPPVPDTAFGGGPVGTAPSLARGRPADVPCPL